MVLKVLLPDLAEDPDLVRMFLREAEVAAGLEHPNIVEVYHWGEAEGRQFIAMEHVAGRTLRQIERRVRADGKQLPDWFVLCVARQICDALDHAHSQTDSGGRSLGLVHRDISPENVIVAAEGTVKVLDFGIAKLSAGATKTRAGALKGKHAYLAPEQILAAERDCAVDHRADVYSLGVVMYEMLTSVRPYAADNELALVNRIVNDPTQPLPPRQHAPWLDPIVDALVLQAMAREPEARFQTAAELAHAIQAQLDRRTPAPTASHVAALLDVVFSEPSPVAGSEADAAQVDAGWPEAEAATRPSQSGAIRRGRLPLPRTRSYDAGATTARFSRQAIDEVLRAAGEAKRAAQVDVVVPIEQPPPTQPRGEPPLSSGHAWDVAVERARATAASTLEDGDSVPPPMSAAPPSSHPDPALCPEALALRKFEQALARHRAQDREGAIAALGQAVELDPDNRLYQTNLRILLRRGKPEPE